MADIQCEHESAFTEKAVVYAVKGESCLGVFHKGAVDASTGVLIVVGGRQYRVGAHRQFVLLARALASAGFPVFRFDVRGMGDSVGDVRHYLDTEEDLRVALALLKKQSSRIRRVVVWGLCDGATASIVAANSLEGVHGMMLVNPWVTTDSGSAKVQIKHYYKDRLLHSDFWKKLLTGKLDFRGSAISLLRAIRLAIFPRNDSGDVNVELPSLVFGSLDSYTGATSVIISDSDPTAMEFADAYNARYTGKNTVENTVNLLNVNADHTFSGPGQHEKLIAMTLDFVVSCDTAHS